MKLQNASNTSYNLQMALWTLVLVVAATALGVAVAVAKAASFLLGCWSAHRQFLASPIPGPPTSNFFGETAVPLALCSFFASLATARHAG